MDTILTSFRLPFLLRSLFAGVFFVLSYWLTTNTTVIDSTNLFSVGLPFALISGVTIYGIHRSLFFPFIEWFSNSDCAKKIRGVECKLLWFNNRFRWTLISRNVIKNLVKRWDSSTKKPSEKEQNRAEKMTNWADYIHLQYTSAWCILLGLWVGKIINKEHCYSLHFDISAPNFCCKTHHLHCLLCGLAVIFLLAAFVSNWRSHSVEEHWDDLI